MPTIKDYLASQGEHYFLAWVECVEKPLDDARIAVRHYADARIHRDKEAQEHYNDVIQEALQKTRMCRMHPRHRILQKEAAERYVREAFLVSTTPMHFRDWVTHPSVRRWIDHKLRELGITMHGV